MSDPDGSQPRKSAIQFFESGGEPDQTPPDPRAIVISGRGKSVLPAICITKSVCYSVASAL